MLYKYNLILFLCLILLAFIAFTPRKINETEAVKLAENFVQYSGYADAPIDTSQHKLFFDLNETMLVSLGKYNIDSVIKHRHRSLHPRAYYIAYNADNKEWLIGFLLTSVDVNNLNSVNRDSDLPGRCIIVNSEGKEIRIAHKTPLFSHFKKL